MGPQGCMQGGGGWAQPGKQVCLVRVGSQLMSWDATRGSTYESSAHSITHAAGAGFLISSNHLMQPALQ